MASGRYPKTRERKAGVVPVTVCVAAMSADGRIVGASDRMVTASDIQFEPQQTKIFEIVPTALVMVAGDSSLMSCLQTWQGSWLRK